MDSFGVPQQGENRAKQEETFITSRHFALSSQDWLTAIVGNWVDHAQWSVRCPVRGRFISDRVIWFGEAKSTLGGPCRSFRCKVLPFACLRSILIYQSGRIHCCRGRRLASPLFATL